MPECDKCDEWFSNRSEVSAHKKTKHTKVVPAPANLRLSLGSATASAKKKKGESVRATKSSSSTPVSRPHPKTWECVTCGIKFDNEVMMDFHYFYTCHGGGYYRGMSVADSEKMRQIPLAKRLKMKTVPTAPAKACRTPSSAISNLPMLSAHAPSDAAPEKKSKTAPKSSWNGGIASDSGIPKPSHSSFTTSDLSYEEEEVARKRAYELELETVIDEYAEKYKTVFENEEHRDGVRQDAIRFKWVEMKQYRLRKEEEEKQAEIEREEAIRKRDEENSKQIMKRMRMRLGDECMDAHLRKLEEDKKRKEEESKLSEGERNKLREARDKIREEKEEVRRKEREEEEKIEEEKREAIREKKRQEEAAAARARALNPDVQPIDWCLFNMEESDKEDDEKKAAILVRQKTDPRRLSVDAMYEASAQLFIEVFNTSIESIGYANVFNSPQTFRVQHKMEAYRREMNKDQRFIDCWKPINTRRERIERSLKKAFTQSMNDVYQERKIEWNEEIKKTKECLNYNMMKGAAYNLSIAMSPDAKTVIYGVAKPTYDADKAEIAELVKEEWSEKRGRSTKAKFVKIVTPEEPEYYISKYLLEEMSEDDEWKMWRKLEKKTGEMTIHLPIVVQNDEMDAYAVHRVYWRELIDNRARGYQLWLTEPPKSAYTWNTIKTAIEARISQA